MLYRCVAIALSCLANSLMAAPANTVSSLHADTDTITLIVPIDIVGATDEVVARWHTGIDRAWNAGNDGRPFAVCGRAVRFDAQFTRRASTNPSRTAHLVVVRPVTAGEQFVSSVWHALGTSPSYSARTGYWGSDLNGATAAHEFGHLLGLLDEYIAGANDTSAFEPRGAVLPDLARHADAPFSLMSGANGSVLARHIDEILRMHGGDELRSCDRSSSELRTKN